MIVFTNCMMQHFWLDVICSTLSVINRFLNKSQKTSHKNNFNKGFDFIDLPCLFQDKSEVYTWLFPQFWTPIIWQTKPIRNIIFYSINVCLVLTSMLILLIHEPECKDFKSIYLSAAHVVTGTSKCLKCRLPSHIDFNRCNEEVAFASNSFDNRWWKRESVECNVLKKWISICNIVDKSVTRYSHNTNLLPHRPTSSFRHLKHGIQEFHGKHVFVPAGKTTDNIVIFCRMYKINKLWKA